MSVVDTLNQLKEAGQTPVCLLHIPTLFHYFLQWAIPTPFFHFQCFFLKSCLIEAKLLVVTMAKFDYFNVE